MMHQSGCHLSTLQRHPQGFQGEVRFQIGRYRPADAAPRVGIEDDRQVDELPQQPDVGDVDGMVANDKFCMTRTAQLKLRKLCSSVLRPFYQD